MAECTAPPEPGSRRCPFCHAIGTNGDGGNSVPAGHVPLDLLTRSLWVGAAVADLLGGDPAAGGEVPLGRWNRGPVVLIRDDELADRASVPMTGSVVQFTFGGPTFHGLAAARRGVAESTAGG